MNLTLEAMEKDEYWIVCEHIQKARFADVDILAAALEDFGLVDLAVIAQQTKRRLEFLDHLDALDQNPATLEKEMHKALDTNLWVFGPQYSMMASNKTLARTIEEYTGKKFSGKRADKRPDLFLAQDAQNMYLLIEFKRPTDEVGRDAEAQAKKYRDDLTPNFGKIVILIIGGTVDSKMASQYADSGVNFLSYKAVISRARQSLEWLLKELA
ncbi:MAG: VRR-NUC domain-containing protein [Planctomycetaceae bacterium]|nr:VRR-NUC domain-containing protein [Planctomycetaceae bacterium]